MLTDPRAPATHRPLDPVNQHTRPTTHQRVEERGQVARLQVLPRGEGVRQKREGRVAEERVLARGRLLRLGCRHEQAVRRRVRQRLLREPLELRLAAGAEERGGGRRSHSGCVGGRTIG